MPRPKKETRGRKRTLTPKQRQKNIIASNEKWRKANTKIVNMRFNIDSDADILERLDQVENKADYIRQLVRRDIETSKK